MVGLFPPADQGRGEPALRSISDERVRWGWVVAKREFSKMSSSNSPLRQLENLGQSIWLDYIRRHLLLSPDFRRLIEEDGLKGMTSNPTIFEKAIAGSTDYNEQF